jgi:hypothetical protein
VFAAFVFREELLNGGEHHAARRDGEQLFRQMAAAPPPAPVLAQQLVAAGEGAEKLVVEVVAVGETTSRGILHRRLEHEPPGVKRHRERLARALRVPDDADALVARLATGLPALGEVAGAHPSASHPELAARMRFRHTPMLTAWNW